MFNSKKYRFVSITVVMLLIMLVAVHSPVQANARPIYVVSNWQDYLRLVPLSVQDGHVPLLYNPDKVFTPAVLQFADLYEGLLFSVNGESVQKIIAEQWPLTETIVVAQAQPRFGLIASSIAAVLDVPLFFYPPPAVVLQQMQVKRVIVVGEETVSANVEIVMLREMEEALTYYNKLVGERPVAVLVADDELGFLAAEVAAYHRGNLLFEPEEIRAYQPQYLVWVTQPRAVTSQSVYNLYELSRFTDDSQVYDAGIGIVTGFTPQDISLLLARTYAYSQLKGEWKARLLTANMDNHSLSQSTYEQPFEVVSLVGENLTGYAFLKAMQSVGYVSIVAHGSPSGFDLVDGSWPGTGSNKITGLPPLIFVAESCLTGDIGGEGLSNSVALKIIAGGAVAYIGSLEIGGVGLIGDPSYAFSTPAVPLGTIVRLQNAARLDVDADTPRSILIGDPPFHQFDQEFISYKIFSEASKVRVQIQWGDEPGPAVIALELQDDRPVQYAVARREENQDIYYVRGVVYIGRTLTSDLSFGRTVVLLEWPGGDGELTLYSVQTPGTILLRILSNSLIGVQGIFIDMLKQVGLPLAVVSFFILRSLWSKRKRTLGTHMLWASALIGIGISLIGIVYCLALGFFIPWSVIAAIGFFATTVILIIHPRWREWRRIAMCIGLYIAPLMLVWITAALVGSSLRVLFVLLWGMILIGLVYGLVILVTLSLFKKTKVPIGVVI